MVLAGANDGDTNDHQGAAPQAPTAAANSEETRKFYEDFLGLPLAHTLGDPGDQGRVVRRYAAHVLRDGRRLVFWRSSKHPTCRFIFKKQKDFDLHIAPRSRTRDAGAHACQGQEGRRWKRAASRITTFIRSIYFRDPNGYVIRA